MILVLLYVVDLLYAFPDLNPVVLAFVFMSLTGQGFGETYPHNPKVVSDMTALHHIHEAGMLHNLGQRAQLRDQKPYTFMVWRHGTEASPFLVAK